MRSNSVSAIFIFIFIFTAYLGQSQNQQFWNIQNRSSVDQNQIQQIPADYYQIIYWDTLSLKEFLTNTPDEFSIEAQRMFKRLSIPNKDGNSIWFRVLKTELLSPETAKEFPFIQSYIIISEDQPSYKGRILLSHLGVHISYMDDGFMTYIEPFKTHHDNGLHFIYQSNEISQPLDFKCLTEHNEDIDNDHQHGNSRYGDCQLRTYRFAVAATGEYTAWAGNQTNALASIAATVNNMNVVFERDAEVRLMLVSNLSIIFADAGTDPYNAGTLNQALLDVNTSTLNTNIGSGNYDIGHVFHAGWNGGLAYRPAACQAQKGGGASGASNPAGFVFETTANHEVAHMLDAVHTHSANNGVCGNGNLTLAGAYEPGGGSTLMAYGGVCFPNSYQNDSDNYFHTSTMSRMAAYITSGSGNTCGTVSGGNNAPIVTIPQSSYSIPNGTPFQLSASGSDPNGNSLTYTWEQIDLAASGISTPPDPGATGGPNFRSRPPSTSPLRYFPAFDNVVSGVDNPYEVLPTVARTMNFRVTVRDNAAIYGCTDEADVAITTTGSGPFQVTTPNGPVTLNFNGSNTFEVTWDVAGSASAPVNCANVDILFSDDAGTTFSTILLSSTPNDGSQTILVPNIETSSGRILVRCSNGIFYNVNSGLITINSGCLAVGGSITPSTQLSADEGSPELSNLGMSAVYGQVITPIMGSVTTSDILSSVVVYSSVSMGCINFNGNIVHLDTIPFYVSVSGDYTINRSGPFGLVTNIYQTSFSTGTLCENFIASSYSTGTGSSSNVSGNLVSGVKYILVISSFDEGSPALPATYTVTLAAAPPGGSLISGPLNPGAGFSYTFIVRDAFLGNVVFISENPDLSTLPAGNYFITGLSYSNSSSVPAAPFNYAAFVSDYVVNGLGGFCGKVSLNERSVIIQAPLSVNFLSFTAQKDGTRGLLQWEVSEEKDLDHYILERSNDAMNFSGLGIIVANNEGKSGESFYQFYDEQPLSGKNYYRLSGVDLDGTLSSAGIAQLTFIGDLSLRIFPNPVNENQLTFVYDSASDSDRIMSIYNMQGFLMSQAEMNGMNTGAEPQHINISKLPPGVYIFEIIEGESTIRKRFVKSK